MTSLSHNWCMWGDCGFIYWLLCWLLFCTQVEIRISAAESSPKKTNIVLILADDLGWTDLTCNGSDFHETPNLDQLGGTMPYAAVRSGDLKLIEFFNDMHVELYDQRAAGSIHNIPGKSQRATGKSSRLAAESQCTNAHPQPPLRPLKA